MIKIMKGIFVLFLNCLLGLATAQAESLTEVEDFGDNPGDISMYRYVPEEMPENAPLVISLHGCKMDAETYSKNGWIDIANEWKFYVIYPEQSLTNNIYHCWNWFAVEDTTRGQGEIQSIINMVKRMQADYSIDPNRIYVEGLSAGGYMTAVLLATYPDIFAGGATIGGGPAYCTINEKHFWDLFNWWYYFSARSNAETCIEGVDKTPEEWGKLVRENGYADYNGPWPILSIWQGGDDDIVAKMNQQELIEQWTDVNGIDQVEDTQETLPDNGIIHTEYKDNTGRTKVESWLIPEMEHGTPINEGSEQCGEESDYILDAGICAVRRIGLFWGLGR